VLREP
jgi:ABC-type lipopolysaccharide export system ATPase subunit